KKHARLLGYDVSELVEVSLLASRTCPLFSNGMEYDAASMRVRYTLRARGDLEAIYNFLDERNPSVAQSVKDLIGYRIAGLADFPFKARLKKRTSLYE